MPRKTLSSAASGNAIASTTKIATTKASPISLSVDHPRLLETRPESICVFLRKCNQYANQIIFRARQLGSDTASTKPAQPVDLKFCMDVEYLESFIALDFISDVTDYADLLEEQVREFLGDRSKESKKVVTLDKLNKVLKSELRTNMKNSNATA